MIKLRSLATPALVFCQIGTACAHEWHRHSPVEESPFEIAGDQAAEPANSVVVAELASSFAAFFPKVRYFWDEDFFYVESDAIPDHDTMTGITSWQQQLPVPQNYYGDNAWRIPLSPQKTDQAVSAADSLFRGGIAIAVNGIPIFNPIKNNGVTDTYLAGELDNWGGHCGRGDDYHYHIAPWHLQDIVGDNAPLAYALDGFPILGDKETDGSDVDYELLDEFNGHEHDGPYHYHASHTYPYVNGGIYLNPPFVNLESGGGANPPEQIGPQPTTRPTRPALPPLAGAEITGFERADEDDYTVTYTRGGDSYSVQVVYDRGAGTIGYIYDDQAYGAGASPELHSGWTPPLETISTTMTLTESPAGNLAFTMTGEPGRGYPFYVTDDLVDWKLFGFRLLDVSGETSFELEPAADRGFLRSVTTGVDLVVQNQGIANWSMVALPDTGQSDGFTATFGEDNDYAINPPSYTDNGDGTITDNVTGLMWKQDDGGEMTWDGAAVYCESLDTGGHDDWRMPNAHELFSIVHLNRNRPPLDAVFISPITADHWWSSDEQSGNPNNAWSVNRGGGIGPKPKAETTSAGGTLNYHIRAVRDITVPTGSIVAGPQLTDNGDGTVTDANTGLVWQTAEGGAMSWEDALLYAEGLSLAGDDDWRLPNIRELFSLVDVNRTNPAIDTSLFPGVSATQGENLYWSSTNNFRRPGEPWYVEYRFGLTSFNAGTNLYNVRCVRGEGH